jgi:hypothetical protein
MPDTQVITQPIVTTAVVAAPTDELQKLRDELQRRDELIEKLREGEKAAQKDLNKLGRIEPIFKAQLEAMRLSVDPEILPDIQDLPVDRQYSLLQKLNAKNQPTTPVVTPTITPQVTPVAATAGQTPISSAPPPTTVVTKPMEQPLSSYEIELENAKRKNHGVIRSQELIALKRKHKLLPE